MPQFIYGNILPMLFWSKIARQIKLLAFMFLVYSIDVTVVTTVNYNRYKTVEALVEGKLGDYHSQNLFICDQYNFSKCVYLTILGASLGFNVPAGCFVTYCDCLINHCLTSCYL